MPLLTRCSSISLALLLALWPALAGAEAPISYLGEAHLPGDSRDRSGLEKELIQDHPANQFGGISAIEHWQGNQYLLLPDRGFGDGAVTYQTRYHVATIDVAAAKGGMIPISVDQTTLLSDKHQQPLVGRDSTIRSGLDGPARLDPEDIRVVRPPGVPPLLAISDEYGPRVDLYGLDGRRVREYAIPGHYQVAVSGTEDQEQVNSRGRQTNGGFEALGITPDSSTLYAVTQVPLLQDGGEKGRFDRMLQIDIPTGAMRELAYCRESKDTVICSLLSIDPHRALILERDGQAGHEAKVKKVKLVDFHHATPIPPETSLPNDPDDLPDSITPVVAEEFLNLLDFKAIREETPKKFEGLAFGPDLADGRKLLLVSVDNDFAVKKPTRIFAFAVRIPGAR